MKTIRTAVIGTGFIGPAHLEALRRIGGVDIVALASTDPGKAHDLADRFSIPSVYNDWTSVIEDGSVEVVHNCTPNNLHFAINKAAILAGKHVMSEKPLTLTSKESAELVALARRRKIVNAVNFNYRFYPLIQQARAMVEQGELGDIYLVHGHYLQDWLFFDTDYNWRLEPKISGASRAIADIGSHWCDLVQFITGERISAVCGELVTIHRTRHKPAGSVETFKGKEIARRNEGSVVTVRTEDAGSVLLRFANGARGVFTVSQVSAGRKNREWFEIDGSRKAIAWNQEEPNTLWVGCREKANETIIKDPSLLVDSARPYAHYPGGHPEGYPDGLLNHFANFYTHIRKSETGRGTPDFPTFADGHRENLIVEAILRSARLGRWVEV